MSALLNIIYREYCRARLAEMRQPVPLLVPSDNACRGEAKPWHHSGGVLR
jgi:hypothetical protein